MAAITLHNILILSAFFLLGWLQSLDCRGLLPGQLFCHCRWPFPAVADAADWRRRQAKLDFVGLRRGGSVCISYLFVSLRILDALIVELVFVYRD